MIFSDFSGGISDSILRGVDGSFATLVGLNIHETPGLITPNQKLSINSGYVITELCKNVVNASDGNTYFFSSESGKIWKKTSADVYTLVHTNTKGANLGAKEYNGYIYYVGAGFLGRQSVALAASEASWSSQDDDYQTFTNAETVFAPMEEQNGILFIGNGNLIASFDETTFQTAALDLPSYFRISALYPWGIELLVGTYVGAGTTNLAKTNYCKLFRWNTYTTDSWNDSDVIYEAGINAFIPADNNVFVQAGINGQIYYYNGSQLIPYRKIPGTFSATAYGLVYANAVGWFKGLPIFGFSNSPDTANSTGNPANCGIYSLGQFSPNYKRVLNLEFPLSVINPLASVEIGSIITIGNNVYSSWKKKLTITLSITNPCVVAPYSLGITNGTEVKFITTGALPTGITAGTAYYVRTTIINTINLYDTAAHAIDTGATTGRITTSGTQSGVHTMSWAGVDKIDYTTKYASAYLETLVFNKGIFNKELYELFASYYSMPTGCSLSFSTKKNYASSWTASPTPENETEYGLIRTQDNMRFIKAIQFKINFTTSSNNAPILDYIGFNFN